MGRKELRGEERGSVLHTEGTTCAKALRQVRTQHIQETARRPVRPEQKDGGVKGCPTVHLLPLPPPQAPHGEGRAVQPPGLRPQNSLQNAAQVRGI